MKTCSIIVINLCTPDPFGVKKWGDMTPSSYGCAAPVRTYSGCEPIPYWVYKHCAIELTPIVTHIFNLTLSCGHPPAAWKHSIVTPIPKVNPPQQLSDLRPISVTPILSRCFEKLFVKHHFFPALPTSDLQDQFAFRPTGSTTNARDMPLGGTLRCRVTTCS